MPDKLLEALRSSPLQRLPVPDSFSRLEWWSNMRDSLERTSRSCSCEKRNFSQSINRLSNEPGLSESAHQLWELGQLPGNMNHQHPHRGHLLDITGPIGTPEEDETASEHRRSLEVDFFGDELRGYRLLKAAKPTTSERQHILTLTTNSTRFIEVRRALRTLFAEENVEDGMNQRPRRAVWFQDSETWDEMHYEEEDQEWSEDWWSAEEDAY